ncbi:GNAT family N-acetyltransferase [Viridibacillus sp. NPDC093762]|uniref:GNAT family N-acetyltransferase n=1 Tax=Viridibacillus sp. NPDC093762 TaxID=3390720 RepID=UPI003D026604
MEDNLELIQITTYMDLGRYEKEWSAILEENDNTNPFIEYEFVYNWWRFLGKEEKVEIYAVKENNRMIAFFPFQSEKTWYGYILHFLALGDANYMDIIARKRDIDRVIMFVFDALIKRKKSVVFYLHGLLESVETHSKLSNYLKARNMKERYSRIVTPYIDLDNISYEEYMKPRHKLHGLDRREKRLRALGDVQLQISSATEMDQVFKVHQKRWEKKNDTSGFSSNRKQAFFKYLAEQNDGKLSVRLSTLTLQNEMVAFTYGFACRGRYLGYVLGHDSDFDVYGPGRILVKEKIKRNIDDGFHKLDMSIGYEPYKLEWNTNFDYTRKTVFSTNTFRASMFRNFLWLKEKVFSKIRKHYSIVIFRRNTIGKLKYYFRNKEKFRFWKDIWKNRLQPFVYEQKQYLIAKMTVNEMRLNSHFEQITLEMALSMKNDRKEILQKIYNGYKGYYSTDVNKVFWVNENVIRLDDIEVVVNLKKKSIYIRDWENENLKQILSFVQAKYRPKFIFVHVNKRDKKRVQLLQSNEFEITERLSYLRVLGKKKVKKEVEI